MLTYTIPSEKGVKKQDFLYEAVKRDILSGTLSAGERLPSKRTFAEHLGVSVVTVEAVYGKLSDEGYIYSRERSGFFVSALSFPGAVSRAEAAAKAADTAGTGNASKTDAAGEAAYEAAPGDISVDFPYTVMSRIVREVLNDDREALLKRPPNAGIPELREAVSGYLKRYRGMSVSPEQIVIGSGAEALYGMVAQLFGPGSVFGLESPSYRKIRLVYESFGMTCEMLPMDGKGIFPESLERTPARILHVTPFSSYPTGITAPASRRYEYLSWAEKRGGFLVEDDFSSEFAVPRKPLETLWSMDRNGCVIYINTFSKSLAPSMRLGYMVLPEGLMGLYREKLGFYSGTVPTLDQYILARFIADGHFERHLNRIRRRLLQERRKQGRKQ